MASVKIVQKTKKTKNKPGFTYPDFFIAKIILDN